MVPNKNPGRKINKQIRRAIEKGDLMKVEELQQELDNFLKCKETNERNKRIKEQKKQMTSMTDDEFLNQAQEYNKQHFNEKQEKEEKEKEVKKRSLEKERLRTKIMNDKKVKQEHESENLGHMETEYDMQGQKKQTFLNNMKEHEAKLKVEKYEELDKLHDSIMKGLNGNKKKTKKLYNKIIKEHAQMIELAIHGYMDEHDVDYEEASNKFYLQMREPRQQQTKDPEPLQILDNYAKL